MDPLNEWKIGNHLCTATSCNDDNDEKKNQVHQMQEIRALCVHKFADVPVAFIFYEELSGIYMCQLRKSFERISRLIQKARRKYD